MRYTKKTFSGDEVLLDGNEYYECIFTNCRLVYRGGGDMSIVGCTFDNPQWVFGGSAANTIRFLEAIYRDGGRMLIEQTFDNIRGEA
ncbi:MAG: hypothetical protein FJZ88_08325 [Chloroflexi bacterium]|nr:hypothetical protein [Chloroflexota bacterium]